MYHEEMLKQSPRQQLFKDYAKELMCRYPQLKQEIMQRISHVSELWCEVMDKLVLPSGGGQPDLAIILNGTHLMMFCLTNVTEIAVSSLKLCTKGGVLNC
jgi:hypothetical protein